MKNIIIIIVSVLCFSQAKSQELVHTLDTIYANENKNVALFFPNPIRQGITGSDNFVFTYNREKEQYFGLLQATPGIESNLLIINNNGSIYSYIVGYKKHLKQLNYFVPDSASIGNEAPTLTKQDIPNDSLKTINQKSQYYERFCSYLIDRRQRIGIFKKRNQGIVLTLKNIVFDRDELYFVIEIENTSSLDYDLNFLDISIETRKRGKKKSLQRIKQTPNYTFKVPETIKEKETKLMVFVLPKFSISSERQVVLDLNELNGERNVKLKISKDYINNPN